MATELQVFLLVRVTVNAPLERASLVWITRTATGTSTGTHISVNSVLLQWQPCWLSLCGFCSLCHFRLYFNVLAAVTFIGTVACEYIADGKT